MDITVNSTQGLTAALKTAQSGDVIKLSAGDYSISLYNMKFAGNVTITSLDPANQATFSSVAVNQSENVTFKDLTFFVDPAKSDGSFRVLNSSNIHFDHLDVHGSLNGNPQDDKTGLVFQASKNVSVTNSEFQQLSFGIVHQNSDGIKVSNNYFHDMRSDGVRGGGSSHVTITDNQFRDFYPNAADHPDAIQFWTTNAVSSATDILVSGNIVMRGAGAPIQGVFFRDEQEIYPYKNVIISDNLVIGASYNGIQISRAENVTLSGNTVVALNDQASWLAVGSVTGVTLTGNTATAYQLNGNTGLTQANNSTVAAATDGGKAAFDAWMATHSTDAHLVSSATENFATASSLAAKAIDAVITQVVNIAGGEGADLLRVDGTRSTLANGGAGNDTLMGGGLGSNTLKGGAGDDTYYVRSSRDTVVEDANSGSDQVLSSIDHTLGANLESLRLIDGARVGTGNELSNRIQGQAGNETLSGLGGNDVLQGEAGNDLSLGGAGDDTLYMGAGNDTGVGGDGVDKLSGAAGDDSLSGGAGKDSIAGDEGADTISGGLDADTFAFGNGSLGTVATDHIVDFSSAQGDKLAMGGIDANTTVAGDQAFKFIGTAVFHKVAGELRYDVVNGSTCIMGDTNGDGVADLKLWLDGVKSISGGDIWL